MRSFIVVLVVCLLALFAGSAWATSWSLNFNSWTGPSPAYEGDSLVVGWADGVHTSDAWCAGGGTNFFVHNLYTTGSEDGQTATQYNAGDGNFRGGMYSGTPNGNTWAIDLNTGVTMETRLNPITLGGQCIASYINFDQVYAGPLNYGIGIILGLSPGNMIGVYNNSRVALREEVSTVALEGGWHTTQLRTKIIGGDVVFDVVVDGIAQYKDQTASDGSKHFLVTTGDCEQYIWGDGGYNGFDIGMYEWTDAAYNVVYDRFTITNGIVPEPSSVLAMASGLIGMAGFAIRRRR